MASKIKSRVSSRKKPAQVSNDPIMDFDVADMAEMIPLTASTVMDNLQNRFARDCIFTRVSEIIISVNPYKYVDAVFSQDLFDRYQYNVPEAEIRSLPPHLYAIARRAYRGAIGFDKGLVDSRDQSILISGESGAGKTEASKLALRYFANMSARRAREITNMHHDLLKAAQEEAFIEGQKEAAQATRERHRDKHHAPVVSVQGGEDEVCEMGGEAYTELDLDESVEDKLISADPVLEAFGNAKTLRNDNSSRFGKFVSLQLNKQGIIVGGKITKYLLEESRVCTQYAGERNFNIFYQVVAGAGEKGLYNAEKFAYLRVSGCHTIPGVDDRQKFGELVDAMRCLQLCLEDRTAVFNVIKAILHLGNLDFEVTQGRDKKAGSTISDGSKQHLMMVAKLLAIDPGSDNKKSAERTAVSGFAKMLGKALCSRPIISPRETILVHNTPPQAEAVRHSMAKTMYGFLMTWIVDRLNLSISKQQGVLGGSTIGVLDIFGFEAFEHNSFEQLCINYANEKLQQHFLSVLTKTEVLLYKAEGLDVHKLQFRDNTKCVELLEKRPVGIFCVLADMLATKGNDQGFVDRIIEQHRSHSHFATPRFQSSKPEFIVEHYAHPVTYDATGFMAKNQSKLGRHVQELCQNKGNGLVRDMFTEAARPHRRRSSAISKKSNNSLGARFQQSLEELLTSLRKTNSHFIRTIKPNNIKAPKEFHRSEVERQLITSGLIDAVQVRNHGYTNRLTHGAFIRHYSLLLSSPYSAFHAPQLVGKLLPGKLGSVEQVKMIIRKVETVSAEDKDTRTGKTGTRGKTHTDPLTNFSVTSRSSKTHTRHAGGEGTGWQVGRTRVFYRASLFELLETARDQVVEQSAMQLQRRIRGKLDRIKFKPQLLVWHKICECVAHKAWNDGMLEASVHAARKAGVSDSMLSRVLIHRDRMVDIQNQELLIMESLYLLFDPPVEGTPLTLQSLATKLDDAVLQAQETASLYNLAGAQLNSPNTRKLNADQVLSAMKKWIDPITWRKGSLSADWHGLCVLLHHAHTVAVVARKVHDKLATLLAKLCRASSAPTSHSSPPASVRAEQMLTTLSELVSNCMDVAARVAVNEALQSRTDLSPRGADSVGAAVLRLCSDVLERVKAVEVVYERVRTAMKARVRSELSDALRAAAKLALRKSPVVLQGIKCLALITTQEEANSAVTRRDPGTLEKLAFRLSNFEEAATQAGTNNVEWADWVKRLQAMIAEPLQDMRETLDVQKQLQAAMDGRNLKRLQNLLQSAAGPPHSMAKDTHPVFKQASKLVDELEARRVIADALGALDAAEEQPLDQIEFLFALAVNLCKHAKILDSDKDLTKLMVWHSLELACRQWQEEDAAMRIEAAIRVARKMCPDQMEEQCLQAEHCLRKAVAYSNLRELVQDPKLTAKMLVVEMAFATDAGLTQAEMEFVHKVSDELGQQPSLNKRGSFKERKRTATLQPDFGGDRGALRRQSSVKAKRKPPAPASFNKQEKLADLISAHGVVRKLDRTVTPAGGWLFCVAHSCSNLLIGDPASSETYCVLRVGTNIQKTTIQAKTLNPAWDEMFRFPIKEILHQELRVVVKSKKFIKRDVVLGSIGIDLADVARMSTQGLGNKGATKRKLHRAWPLRTAERGEIELTVYYVEKLHDQPQFGIDIEECSRRPVEGLASEVPTILLQMEEYLIGNGGLDEVGIFRLAPDAAACDHVKTELNQGCFVECEDVNNVSNLIKVWFRDLPVKVLNQIPVDMFPLFKDKRIPAEQAQKLIELLDEPNKSIMMWLLNLCVKVIENEAVNRMSPQALSIVFGPNLFEISSDPLVMLSHTTMVSQWLERAIAYRLSAAMAARVEERLARHSSPPHISSPSTASSPPKRTPSSKTGSPGKPALAVNTSSLSQKKGKPSPGRRGRRTPRKKKPPSVAAMDLWEGS